MASTEQLEQEIKVLKKRNQRVEADKAWETSVTRRALLTMFTYLALGIYMWFIDIDRPWLNAIVPTVGFMLSTLSMPWFKQRWIKSQKKKKTTE
jgi:hypothetical protein